MSKSSDWKEKNIKSYPDEQNPKGLSNLTDEDLFAEIKKIEELEKETYDRLYAKLNILSNGDCEDSEIKGLNDEADNLEKTVDELHRQVGTIYKELINRCLLRIKASEENLKGNGR